MQRYEAKVDIATGSGDLQAGSASRSIAAVTAIARVEGCAVELALTAVTAGCIGNDRGIIENGGCAVDIDRSNAAIGGATVAAIQAIATITADTAGIDDVDRIVQIVLIDIDCGIAAGAAAAIARDIIRIAGGKTEYLAAIAAGADRIYRELTEIECACIIVERRIAASGVATIAGNTGLDLVAEGIISIAR